MVLTTRIYQHTTLGGVEMMQRASALALVLLATSVLAQAIAAAIARQRSIVQVTGKASRPSPLRLGRARAPIALALALFAAIFVILPIATIAWTSLQRTFADPLLLTTAHWSAVLARAETMRAFLHSVVLALAAGAIVCALGFVLSRASKRGRTGEHLSTLASAPYAVPGTVLAIGLILTFSREIRVIVLERLTLILHLHGTLFMLLAAYAVKYLAFGVRASRAALDQLHPSLEEAARTSGAGPVRSTRDVVLPLVSPAIGAAFVLTALTCLSELTMSVLLFGPGTETAGTLLFELQSYGDPPAAAVVACVIVVLVIAGDAAARRLERAARSRTR
jgi:iron(III) transport system permease protein